MKQFTKRGGANGTTAGQQSFLIDSGKLGNMKRPSTLRKFSDTPEDKNAYLACLQNGGGFIANCCSGYPEGYKFHRASCVFLDINKYHNPICGTTGKIWAESLKELEANEVRNPGKYPATQCRCLQTMPPDEHDTDMERESHLVVPGGRVESNRGRH